jgi:hypothetical protein
MTPQAHIRSLPSGTWKGPFVAQWGLTSLETARREVA